MLSTALQRLEARLGEHFAQLVRGLGAYGSAEFLSRLVRLATTVVIARRLAPDIVGEAALALSVFERVRVLERTGTGQQIVRAPADRLAATCNTIQRFYLVWTGLLIVVQLLVALILGTVFARPLAGMMLACLALVYPFMAFGHVQLFLAMRAGHVGRLARINATQSIADQLLTAAMLLQWASPWSIVLPKLLTAPIWLIQTRRAAKWQSDPAAGMLPLAEVLRYAGSVLVADGLTALRTQGDNLIVAAALGTRALGTYFFAFNAGIGILSSLIGAFGSVIFPMFCRAVPGGPRRAVLRRAGLGGLMLFVPLIALQALGAPWYVPLVFGARWAFAAPYIATMCLAGVPLMLNQLATSWLRAEGRVGTDAMISATTCVTALGGLAIGVQSGRIDLAIIGLVVGQTLAAAWFAVRVLLPALRGVPAALEPAHG